MNRTGAMSWFTTSFSEPVMLVGIANRKDTHVLEYNVDLTLSHLHQYYSIRAPLHLEAGPIHCVRGFKSSLVIGQKVQIGPNLFTPRGRADLVV
jgi:hypothetical protein